MYASVTQSCGLGVSAHALSRCRLRAALRGRSRRFGPAPRQRTRRPMALSMFDASVPSMLRQLAALDAILDKAAAHAAARMIDPAVLLAARLHPDMFAL